MKANAIVDKLFVVDQTAQMTSLDTNDTIPGNQRYNTELDFSMKTYGESRRCVPMCGYTELLAEFKSCVYLGVGGWFDMIGRIHRIARGKRE